MDRIWLFDTLNPSPVLRSFFRWLISCDQIAVLGFAFECDAEKISAVIQDVGYFKKKMETDVIDLQALAMQHLPRGRTPGLKDITQNWLGCTLDKMEQCSDWDRRPLTESQL